MLCWFRHRLNPAGGGEMGGCAMVVATSGSQTEYP
jgi:hypothetical protein